MKKELSKIFAGFIALAAMAVAGCNNDPAAQNGAYRVRIPLDDKQGHYSLQTVELRTVTDIHAMAGTSANILADGRFDISNDDDGHEELDSAVMGSSPSAQFINNGGVLVPTDFKSLSMTAAMYHFESIKNFYDAVQGNEGLKFPRLVLMNVTVAVTDGSSEVDTVNNAAYVPGLDLFWINPYNDAQVPLVFNGGVLAHEYLHSIFEKRLEKASANILTGSTTFKRDAWLKNFSPFRVNEWYQALGATPSAVKIPQPKGVVQLDSKDVKSINTLVFGGLNEGIADYFGYEYSQNPSWIMASLPSQSFRVLSKDKEFPLSSDDQQRFFDASVNSEQGLDVHWLGAFFSHMLYLTSQDWGDVATETATLTFMDRYAELLASIADKRYISLGELVKLFFQDRSPTGTLCQDVKNIFPGELTDSTFSCVDNPPSSNAAIPTGADE